MVNISGSVDEQIDAIAKLVNNGQYLIMTIETPDNEKSYIAQKIIDHCKNAKVAIVSVDSIRNILFGDNSDKDNNEYVFNVVYRLCRKNFNNGYSVILDSASIDKESRKREMKQAIPFSMDDIIHTIGVNVKNDASIIEKAEFDYLASILNT